MSYGIKKATRYRPCPICGKPDWCGFMPDERLAGAELVICMRDTRKCNTEGFDGKQYVFLSNSRTGNSVYEEYTQWSARKKIRMGQKDVEFKPKKETVLTPVGIIEPASDEHCEMVYRFMQEKLVLDRKHRDYLHGQGWDDTLIEQQRIVSFPEEDFLRSRYKNRTRSKCMSRGQLADRILKEFGPDSLIGVPGAYVRDGKWTFAGPSGIVFPMYSMDQKMFRLRIRRDFMDVSQQVFMGEDVPYFYEDKNRFFISMRGIYSEDRSGNKCFINSGGKYRTLASFYQDKEAAKQGFFSNKYEKGCQAVNALSLYTRPADDRSIWYFTEGEPKGIYSNYKMGSPVVTIPGVNSYALALRPENIQKMKDTGMQMAVVAFDADKSHNEKVLDCEKRLVEGLKAANITTAIGSWDERIGKGIDDMLAAGGSIDYFLV